MSVNVPRFPLVRFLLATATVVLGVAAFSSVAQAACSYPDAEQVFSEYGDNAYYELAPDGGLEGGGTGWEFTGAAKLVTGDQTSTVSDSADQVELSIPYGSTAISPRVCVDETTPHFRMMTINSGKKDTRLKVKVSYEFLKDRELRTETRNYEIRATNLWAPSDEIELRADRGQERIARISFTPKEKEGIWLIDDLYIDPFARR
jgi:hypothetical protein